jgi:hypothetical protein
MGQGIDARESRSEADAKGSARDLTTAARTRFRSMKVERVYDLNAAKQHGM